MSGSFYASRRDTDIGRYPRISQGEKAALCTIGDNPSTSWGTIGRALSYSHTYVAP